MKNKTVISRMISNARAYNNVLSEEHLKAMDVKTLLAHIHPMDRKDFAYELYKIEELSEREYKELTKPKTKPAPSGKYY